MGSSAQGKLHELSVDQSMDLEHSMFEPSSRGKLSALQRQESCLFNLTIGQNTTVLPFPSTFTDSTKMHFFFVFCGSRHSNTMFQDTLLVDTLLEFMVLFDSRNQANIPTHISGEKTLTKVTVETVLFSVED